MWLHLNHSDALSCSCLYGMYVIVWNSFHINLPSVPAQGCISRLVCLFVMIRFFDLDIRLTEMSSSDWIAKDWVFVCLGVRLKMKGSKRLDMSHHTWSHKPDLTSHLNMVWKLQEGKLLANRKFQNSVDGVLNCSWRRTGLPKPVIVVFPLLSLVLS